MYVWNRNKIKFNHAKIFPENLRLLIVGSSGCGKTQLLFKMLLEKDFLDYNNLIIFSKTCFQDEYQLLKYGFQNELSKKSITKIFKEQNDFDSDLSIQEICEIYSERFPEKNNISITMTNKMNEIPDPNELLSNKKNLIIFDDCVNETNQKNIENYFTRGRHNNISCIYLSQSWFELGRRSIRNNSNFIILFELNNKDKNIIYDDIFSKSLEKSEFNKITNKQWRLPYQYIAYNLINKNLYTDIFTYKNDLEHL